MTTLSTKLAALLAKRGQDYYTEFDDFMTSITSAQNGVGAGLVATSTTSASIGTGAKSLTIQGDKNFAAGQFVIAYQTSNVANFMIGVADSYNGDTGALAFTVASGDTGGSGTITDWNVAVSGRRGATGATGGGLAGLVDDASPQLGADLDVNGFGVVSAADGNIPIQPNGTGRAAIKNPTVSGSAEGAYDDVGNVTGAAAVTGAPYSRIRLTGDTTVTLADPSGTAIMACWLEVAQGPSGGWTPTFTGYTFLGTEPAWTGQAEDHVTILGRYVTPTGLKHIWFISEVAP